MTGSRKGVAERKTHQENVRRKVLVNILDCQQTTTKNELVAGRNIFQRALTLLKSYAGTLVMDRRNEGSEDSPP